MMLEFDNNLERELIKIAAKLDQPINQVVVEALGIYSAIVELGGKPAAIVGGNTIEITLVSGNEPVCGACGQAKSWHDEHHPRHMFVERAKA